MEAWASAAQTGSFLNMAPEVVLGQPYYEKADIFSLGCCLSEVPLSLQLAALIQSLTCLVGSAVTCGQSISCAANPAWQPARVGTSFVTRLCRPAEHTDHAREGVGNSILYRCIPGH